MQVTTTFSIEGHEIVEYRGIVRGIIVRAPTIAQGIVGGLKSIVGGRIGAYTEMCEQARQQAFDQMVQHAAQLGANAIVGVRYDASEVASKSSATEVCSATARRSWCAKRRMAVDRAGGSPTNLRSVPACQPVRSVFPASTGRQAASGTLRR
jgi:uncharacterized protein YbjQ (UPF0145 family)